MTGKGTTKRTIRMEAALWDLLGDVAQRNDRDRADVLRDFARWYVGEPGAELPARPLPPAP